jgi:Transglutaminase-like superfamily
MKLLHKLKTLLRMTQSDRQLLTFTVLLLISIRLGLWLLPFQTLLRKLNQVSYKAAQFPSQPPLSIASILWSVNVISRYFAPGSKCLARALTMKVLLDWQGQPNDLRIGVAKGDGKLEAHAWVEVQGQIVIGYLSDLARYTLLPTLPPIHSASGV